MSKIEKFEKNSDTPGNRNECIRLGESEDMDRAARKTIAEMINASRIRIEINSNLA